MIWGMSISAFTRLHVILSLVGIVSGLVVTLGLLGHKWLPRTTALFLVTTIATSVTGFGFPIHHFGPPHVVGILSLIVLAIALVARYQPQRAWRRTYVVTSVIALYLNVFVGVVQAFQKIAGLKDLAPTQSEPPFIIAQVAVLIVFVVLGAVATVKSAGQALPAA